MPHPKRWQWVAKPGPLATPCWIWTGGGHKRCRPAIRRVAAHRRYFAFFKGPIPEGLTVDHLCFDWRCMNPDHLDACSNPENSKRWRDRFGAPSPRSRLSRELAEKIRAEYVPGKRHVRNPLVGAEPIAKKHGVTKNTVYSVINGKSWPSRNPVTPKKKLRLNPRGEERVRFPTLTQRCHICRKHALLVRFTGRARRPLRCLHCGWTAHWLSNAVRARDANGMRST